MGNRSLFSSSSASSMRIGILLCIAIACLLDGAIARKDDIKVKRASTRTVLLGHHFGADGYGSVSVHLTIQDHDGDYFYLSLVNGDQYKAVARLSDNDRHSCMPSATLRYEFAGYIQINHTIPVADQYRLILTNCEKDHVDVVGEIQWLNRDGKELSTDDENILYIFIASLIAAVIFLAWYITEVMHHDRYMAHHVLFVALLQFIIQSALSVYLYARYASSGEIMQDVSQLNTLILVMMNCTLLVLILCLSTGWTVVRLYVSGRDRQIIAGAFLGYAGVHLADSLCISPTAYCPLYLFTFHVVKVLIAWTVVYAMCTANMDYLRRTFDVSERQVCLHRLKILSAFRECFIIYLLFPILPAILSFSDLVLWWESSSWITLLVNQILWLWTWGVIFYHLRPHNISFVARLPTSFDQPWGPQAAALLRLMRENADPAAEVHEMEVDVEDERPWWDRPERDGDEEIRQSGEEEEEESVLEQIPDADCDGVYRYESSDSENCSDDELRLTKQETTPS